MEVSKSKKISAPFFVFIISSEITLQGFHGETLFLLIACKSPVFLDMTNIPVSFPGVLLPRPPRPSHHLAKPSSDSGRGIILKPKQVSLGDYSTPNPTPPKKGFFWSVSTIKLEDILTSIKEGVRINIAILSARSKGKCFIFPARLNLGKALC